MDTLREIIHTLSEEEQSEFTSFVNRLKQKSGRKDLELFDLLKQEAELDSKTIVARLYKPANKVAYHALRKRLNAHLTDFIILKTSKGQSSAMSSLSTARYLFDHQSPRLAWKRLRQAEKEAEDMGLHDLLNGIYNLQIERANEQDEISLDTLLSKHAENKVKADEDERASIANSIVREQLMHAKMSGEELKVDEIIYPVLQQYGLNEAFSSRPRLIHDLLSIMRATFLSRKDFYSFEPFVINQYKRIEKGGGFAPRDHPYKLSMLYMIAHTVYRNKKFQLTADYLNILKQELEHADTASFHRFYPRWSQLAAAVSVFAGNLAYASELLENLLNHRTIKLDPATRLTTQVNLGIYHFHAKQYKRSHEAMMNIYHTDGWCEKLMGKEWVMKKNLMEVILFYELEKEELAVSKIRALERKYGALFQQPLYERVRTYLSLIKLMMNDPDQALEEGFAQRVQQSFAFIPMEREDIQAMGFYAWLKSKMVGKDYHEVLMELVN